MAAGDLEREDDDGWVRVREGELVLDGTRVRSPGGAILTVPGGRMSFASGGEAVLATTVTVATGSLLVEVGDSDRMVRAGGVLATGQGTWRVDAGPAQRIAVYDGHVAVRGADVEPSHAGDRPTLGPLEQIDLLAGRLAARALPLRYSREDPWDVRLLAAALTVDREVDRIERALTSQYGEEPRAAGFYTRFAAFGGDDVAASADIVGSSGPAHLITHLVVTRLVARTVGALEAAASEVIDLRRDGATWGLVLARHDLGPEDLRAAIDLDVEVVPLASSPEPADDGAPVPAPTDDVGEQAPPPAAPTPPPAPPTDAEDDDGGGVTAEDPADELEEIVDDLADLVDEVGGGLLP